MQKYYKKFHKWNKWFNIYIWTNNKWKNIYNAWKSTKPRVNYFINLLLFSILPCVLKDLFDLLQKEKDNVFDDNSNIDDESAISTGNTYRVFCTYVEIYNENIHDLLGDANINLDLREDPNKGVIINGVKEIDLDSPDNFFSLLLLGNSKRATEMTNNNATSSRSHAILQIFLEGKNKQKNEMTLSRFVLVDLAGSEKGNSVAAVGTQRVIEGSKINQSLLNLGKCINALAENRGFVSWRDSKLTRILKDSLIGNSRMVMLSTISPSIFSITETINTLLYSSRAKNIQVKVMIAMAKTS